MPEPWNLNGFKAFTTNAKGVKSPSSSSNGEDYAPNRGASLERKRIQRTATIPEQVTQ